MLHSSAAQMLAGSVIAWESLLGCSTGLACNERMASEGTHCFEARERVCTELMTPFCQCAANEAASWAEKAGLTPGLSSEGAMWGVLSESQEALLTDSLKLVRQASSLTWAPQHWVTLVLERFHAPASG